MEQQSGILNYQQTLAVFNKMHEIAEQHKTVKNPLLPQSSDYAVDDEWCGDYGFANFLEDMGPRPELAPLIRRDLSLNFSKKNCFWNTDARTIRANGTTTGQAAVIAIRDFLQYLGVDMKNENFVETPMRVVKAWKKELCAGYSMDPAEILETSFPSSNDQMVILKAVEFYSLCAHHMLPFFGKISIGYIPNNRVVGISKLARLVECFARRLQIQEDLTQQIEREISKSLRPKGVMVVAEAQHLCMTSRGIQKQNSKMITSAISGVFNEPETRAEFLRLIKE